MISGVPSYGFETTGWVRNWCESKVNHLWFWVDHSKIYWWNSALGWNLGLFLPFGQGIQRKSWQKGNEKALQQNSWV